MNFILWWPLYCRGTASDCKRDEYNELFSNLYSAYKTKCGVKFYYSPRNVTNWTKYGETEWFNTIISKKYIRCIINITTGNRTHNHRIHSDDVLLFSLSNLLIVKIIVIGSSLKHFQTQGLVAFHYTFYYIALRMSWSNNNLV